MKYNFAYGSNMYATQMANRCPGTVKAGSARFADYRWIISSRGYAKVTQSKGDEVEGILYALPEIEEAALDGFEGVTSGCYVNAMLTVQRGGVEMNALVYVDPSVGEGSPKEEYVHGINAGLADAGLSPCYVAHSVRQYVP